MIGVILCGGRGTRLNKNKKNKILKPLLKINGKPLISFIIDNFKKNGIKEIILLGGYKISKLNNFVKKLNDPSIKVLNTGLNTETGGRLLYAKEILKNKEFIFTYGDTIVQIDLKKSIKIKNKKNFVFSYYKYKIPYGVYTFNSKKINNIFEKNYSISINSGYYVLDSRIFRFITSFNNSFEKKIIPKVINNKNIEVNSIETTNWMPIDSYQDKIVVEKILKENK